MGELDGGVGYEGKFGYNCPYCHYTALRPPFFYWHLVDEHADTAQCCACEPSEAAEPAPLARIYLPAVMQLMPGMSAEFTPAQPVVTPEPDVKLPFGDASQ